MSRKLISPFCLYRHNLNNPLLSFQKNFSQSIGLGLPRQNCFMRVCAYFSGLQVLRFLSFSFSFPSSAATPLSHLFFCECLSQSLCRERQLSSEKRPPERRLIFSFFALLCFPLSFSRMPTSFSCRPFFALSRVLITWFFTFGVSSSWLTFPLGER